MDDRVRPANLEDAFAVEMDMMLYGAAFITSKGKHVPFKDVHEVKKLNKPVHPEHLREPPPGTLHELRKRVTGYRVCSVCGGYPHGAARITLSKSYKHCSCVTTFDNVWGQVKPPPSVLFERFDWRDKHGWEGDDS